MHPAAVAIAEPIEQPDLPLDGHVEAGPRDVVRVGTDDARRVENHAYTTGAEGGRLTTARSAQMPTAKTRSGFSFESITFINNLRAELDEALGELARVFTFHGYCRRRLHRTPELRTGLTEGFRYYPPLPSLIESDWAIARGRPAPKFVGLMRRLEPGAATAFSLERGDYYDAVSFDDSVFRVQRALAAHPEAIEAYEVVLIDEYQDFNGLEAALLDLTFWRRTGSARQLCGGRVGRACAIRSPGPPDPAPSARIALHSESRAPRTHQPFLAPCRRYDARPTIRQR